MKAIYPPITRKCPYRAGTMKAKCYALFAKGGARMDLLAAMQKLGAARNSAITWLERFRHFAATGEKN